MGNDGVDECVYGGAIGDVNRRGCCLTAIAEDACCYRIGSRPVAIGNDNCRTRCRETPRACSANSCTTACYQCDAISEVAHEDTLSRIVAFAMPPLSHIVHSP